MFFRKNEPEKVALAEIEELAVDTFEKKAGNLEERAQSAVEGIRLAGNEFSEACAVFEALDAEPYVQNIYMPNINALKSHKSAYAKALKHAIEKLDLEPGDAATTYDRYNDILSEVDGTTNEVLGVNANFKTVMYCFSNHLGSVKRAFASFEKHRELLRSEISRRSEMALEHKKLMERIFALNSRLEELETIKESIDAIREGISKKDDSTDAAQEKKILDEISEKKDEISLVNDSMSKLTGEISMLTVPLERPSRKFDHLSVRKKPLYPMIINPISNIADKTEYEEFIDLVGDMMKKIEDGSIDIKNKEGTLRVISELLNSDLFSMCSSFKSLRQKRFEMESGIRVIEGALSDMKKGKRSAESAVNEIKDLEEKKSEISKSIKPTKEAIEAMFLGYYKKQVSVIM